MGSSSVQRSGSLSTPPAGAGDNVEHFADPQGLHQHEIDALRPALLGRQLDAEAGDQDHRHRRRDLLHGLRDLPAGDARHRQVGEHHVEGLGAEPLDGLAAVA
jgi:hypothetical protein